VKFVDPMRNAVVSCLSPISTALMKMSCPSSFSRRSSVFVSAISASVAASELSFGWIGRRYEGNFGEELVPRP